MQEYMFIYRYEGEEYQFNIFAKDINEALARRDQMGLARYEGKIFKTIKLPFFTFTIFRDKS